MQIENSLKLPFKEGDKYGRLTLTSRTYFKVSESSKGTRMITAICDCGVVKDYILDSIKKGDTRSCGCLQKDLLKSFPHAKRHGLRKHPLYRVWDGMKQRCYNPNHEGFEYWGGKNIIVCPEWKEDFVVFYVWAMANGYRKGLTIERRKSSLNYEPSNCYFATYRAQRLNMDDVTSVTAWGETKCIKLWSEDSRCKVTYRGLYNRFNRDKEDWADAEIAISTPPTFRKQNKDNRVETRMIFAFGEEKSLLEWLKDERCVADEAAIRLRLRKGWDAEKAITGKLRQRPIKK